MSMLVPLPNGKTRGTQIFRDIADDEIHKSSVAD
jgi:hypothetical protein